MAFDLEGAKKAGYSDQEIAEYLASESKFDVAGARNAGYSDQEIIGHLSEAQEPTLLQKGSHLAAVTNRAILKGLADLPGVALDVVAYPFRKGTEALTGETIPTYGQLINSGLDQLTTATGVGADPQTPGERILASTARGATGALSGVGVGQQLARSSGPTTAAVGEFLSKNPVVQSVSGAGAGASGQGAKELGAGPGGQLAAALAGGLVTGLAASPFAAVPPPSGLPPGSRLGPPVAATPNSEYQQAVSALEREGIPLTTGQKSGTNWIKSTERTLADIPIGGRPIQNAYEDQARAYQAMLLRQAGLDSGDNMITREVLDKARANLGERYATALRDKSLDLSDDAFVGNLAAIESKHSQMLPFEQKQQVRQIIDDFLEKAAELKQSGRGLTGEEYQRLRSTLGTKATGTQNSYISGLYGDLKGALDDLFAQTAGPDKFAIDKQYARLKQLQTVFERSGGPAASEGFISPIAVAKEAAGAPGGTDWQDLTRAAAAVLPDRLGNSGTAPRSWILNALAGGGALVSPVKTAAGLGATNLLSRQLARGAELPNGQALAEALRRAGYPASLATLQQQ
jgi:hypothetical protein